MDKKPGMGHDPLAEPTGVHGLIRSTTGMKTKDNAKPRAPGKKEMIRVAYSIEKELVTRLKHLAVHKGKELSTLVSTAIKDMIEREGIQVDIKTKGTKT